MTDILYHNVQIPGCTYERKCKAKREKNFRGHGASSTASCCQGSTEYFESKARPLKEDITVPSVFSKNKLLDNLEKEGVGGEGETLTVVQRAENFLNRDVWQIYGARRVLHFASWKPRRVHNSAIIYQTAPAVR